MTSLEPYPEYKESGSEWLGQLPTHWEVVPSKWLFSLRAERPAPGAVHLMASQKYGVISQAKFMAEKDQRVVQTIVGGENMKRIRVNDFLIHLRSFQGGIEWSANEGKVSPAYTVLRPNDGIHPPFFYYLLKSDGYVQELRATTNQLRDGQSMNYSQFAMVPLVDVPWDEQVAIANFLDRETAQIDELIGKQERLIELLAEKRQAIITHAVTKGLDPLAATRYADLGWAGIVNSDWPVIPLKRAGRVSLGKMLQSEQKEATDRKLPYLRAANIQPHGLAVEDRQLMWFTKAEQTHLSLRGGDVVVVEGGAGFGRSDVLSTDLVGWAYQNSINRVRPSSGFDGRFINYVLRAINGTDFNDVVCNKATIPHLTAEKLERHLLVAPSRSEQERISDFLDREIEKLEALSAKAREVIKLLHERRSALISAAVAGKVDVTTKGSSA